MTDSSQASPVLTIEEAGQLLRISRQSAYQAARTGELPTIRIGRRLLVPRQRLLALLGEQPATEGGEAIEEGNRPDASPSVSGRGDLTTALKPLVDPHSPAVLGAIAPAKAAPAGPSHPIP